MQIAQNIMPNGMAAQSDFCEAITNLIKTNKLKKIIETGCYMGEGTTAAIAEALLGDEQVYSIEVNPKYYEAARKKHSGTNINFYLGLSIGRSDVPNSFTFDVHDNIIIDHLDHNRNILYKQEISFKVPDNMLGKALDKLNNRPDLVILDSAGHIGLQEFKYLMDRIEPGFFLALDDTNHVKHYRTYQIVDEMESELIFSTNQGFGSRIYWIG